MKMVAVFVKGGIVFLKSAFLCGGKLKLKPCGRTCGRGGIWIKSCAG